MIEVDELNGSRYVIDAEVVNFGTSAVVECRI